VGILNKLFGRKYAYDDDGEVIGEKRRNDGTIVTGHALGKPVVWIGTEEELRSETRLRKRAEEPLPEEDEQIARRLYDLLSEPTTNSGYGGKIRELRGIRMAPSVLEEIREIGESLYVQGGMEKTELIAHRVRAFGRSIRLLNACWAGIGDWYD